MNTNSNSREKLKKFIEVGKLINSHPELLKLLEMDHAQMPSVVEKLCLETHLVLSDLFPGGFIWNDQIRIDLMEYQYERLSGGLLEKMNQNIQELVHNPNKDFQEEWIFEEVDMYGISFQLFGPKFRELYKIFLQLSLKPDVNILLDEMIVLHDVTENAIARSKLALEIGEDIFLLKNDLQGGCEEINTLKQNLALRIYMQNEKISEKFFQKFKHLLENHE